jgi:hypothetical protein
MNILRQVTKTFGQVQRLLKKGDFSDDAIDRAVHKIAHLADKLEYAMSKSWFLKPLMQDDKPIALFAETAGDSIGEKTFAESHLKAGVMDFDNFSIAVASATSVAAAQGGAQFVSTASFASVSGADVSFTRAYNTTGANYSQSTELLFAVDFKFLKDLNLTLGRDRNIVTHKYADVPDANVARVEFNVVAEAENGAVDVVADALAIEDTLSTTYLGAEILIG